jgi:hypothetical protein
VAPVAAVATVVAVVAVVAVAFALVSCGGGAGPSPGPSATAARATSGIRGIALLEGGPYIASPPPLPAGFGSGRQGRPYPFVTVQVTATSGADAGRVVATLKPDRRALFTVALPPGDYVLEPIVQKDGPAPVQSTVVVTAGRFVRALVYVEAP